MPAVKNFMNNGTLMKVLPSIAALEKFHSVFVSEGREASNHLMDEAAETPPIDIDSMSHFFDDFRCQIFWCTTDGSG